MTAGQNHKQPQQKIYRNEWKYYATDRQLDLLKERLLPIVPLDRYAGEDGTYLVTSLYFDDHKDTCAGENDAGDNQRFKYRIRHYGAQAGETFKLERKEKLFGRCCKDTCTINKEQAIALSKGGAAELFWEAKDPLLRRFCLDIMRKKFEPKVVIRYERTAFSEPLTHIRITFDKNILASPRTEGFFTGIQDWYPVSQKQQILEIKFDRILPGYIRKSMNIDRFPVTAFSKYYLGRKTIEGVYK